MLPSCVIYITLQLLLFVAATESFSQSPNYIDHIGSEEGLASQLCQNLQEDDYGNIWITSFLDIQKYDGYEVTVIPVNEMTINKPIIDLGKDRSGKIWLIQGRNSAKPKQNYSNKIFECSINIIDPLTDKIFPYSQYIDETELKQEDIINTLFYEEAVYLVTKDNSIFLYTDSLQFHKTIIHPDSYVNLDSQGNSIHFENNVLRKYDKENKLIFQEDLSTMANLTALIVSKTGQLFLITEEDEEFSIILHEEKNKTELITLDKKEFPDKIPTIFYSINMYENGYLHINTRLYSTLDSSELAFKNTLGNIHIFEYLPNASKLGFIATNLGVYIIDNKPKIFNQLERGLEKETLNSVRAFFVNDKFKAYRTASKEIITPVSEDCDLSFLEGKPEGQLLSLHYEDPLNKDVFWSVGYMKEPHQVRKIDFSEESHSIIKATPRPRLVTGILRSSQTKNLYISAEPGLYEYDEDSNEFQLLELACMENNKIEASQIVEKNDKLWIACNKGVVVYDEHNNQCSIDSIFSTTVKYTVQYIHSDLNDKEVVWLGTKRGGLVKWNTRLNSTKFYNTGNGLSNNDVHAILEDSQGRLWVSTNRYLNCIDKATDKIFIFTEQDGISQSEFNRWGYFNDTLNNVFYLGGINGYTYFCPDSINTSTDKEEIKVRLIAASKTKNDATIEDIFTPTLTEGSIDFNDKDVSLQLSLSTNHLYRTKNIQYSYRIPGLIDEWETLNSNEIKLNKLPYGEFRLDLIADLNKPAYTSSITTIDIDVIKPFRKTWLARILFTLSFILLTWLIVWRYNINLKKRNLKLEKAITERTKELRELNRTKSKIFTILAHDLRNPIASLADITEKIKFLSKNNRMEELDLLAAQTRGKVNALNDNLNNILLWALNENKTLNLRPEKLSLLIEIRKILDLYLHEIEEKNIKFFYELEDVDQVYLDISVLQTILRNYISNAIKFSYKEGELHFTKNSETEDRIELKIADQGIGILSAEQSDENNSDKNIRNKGAGSGIGLRISKELANVSGINIRIESKKKEGTSVYLDMPKKSMPI